jgi:hypothetical protein
VAPAGPNEHGQLYLVNSLFGDFLSLVLSDIPQCMRAMLSWLPRRKLTVATHHLHLDYAIHEPGEGYVAPGISEDIPYHPKSHLQTAYYLSDGADKWLTR